MKALFLKELRLIVPAFGLALLLAIIPVWLLPQDSYHSTPVLAFNFFWFGVAMLALTPFGREFGLRTFPLLLSQPLDRKRIWRTKMAVLAGATLLAFIAWWFSCSNCFQHVWQQAHVRQQVRVVALWQKADLIDLLDIFALVVLATFATGLWSTLLLRQVIAAFWLTLLIPVALAFSGGADSLTSHIVIDSVLVLYSVAGFILARRQFLQAQEAGWTGGTIAFPSRPRAESVEVSVRRYRPLAALWRKEWQLQTPLLLGIGCLFLLHLAIVAVRAASYFRDKPTVRPLLDLFGTALWPIFALVVASTSVAEERRLGTLEGQLVSPVPSRRQVNLKLVVSLLIGGLLCPALLWMAESFGAVIGSAAAKDWFGHGDFGLLVLFFVGVTLAGFYGSSLGRNLTQALIAGVMTIAGFMAVCTLAAGWNPAYVRIFYDSFFYDYFRPLPWRGPLVLYFLLPLLLVTFFYLAYCNCRSLAGHWRLWRRNILGWLGALFLSATITTIVYNRLWELLTPLEPDPGPARMSLTKPPVLGGNGGVSISALLPDGRLWASGCIYDQGRSILGFGDSGGFYLGPKWVDLDKNRITAISNQFVTTFPRAVPLPAFLPGSNWVDAAVNNRQTVAIRSDGSLWLRPFRFFLEKKEPTEEAQSLVRVGNGNDWQKVVFKSLGSVVLLKKDGSLWTWGGEETKSNGHIWTELRGFEPRRLGTDSDWAQMMSSAGVVYLWNRDGKAFVIDPPIFEPPARHTTLNGLYPLPRFDHLQWRSMSSGYSPAGVRADGTLWIWQRQFDPGRGNSKDLSVELEQVGRDNDWLEVGTQYNHLSALKADGSLWKFDLPLFAPEMPLPTLGEPTRLGARNDWVAVGTMWEGTLSLAADGKLWFWWDRNGEWSGSQPMLRNSRKPVELANVLGKGS